VEIALLASGSRGNASLFAAGGSSVMVDAGIGPRTLKRHLRQLGLPLPQALVITHAHRDHIGHAQLLAEKFKLPLYLSEATARATGLGGHELVRIYSPREPFAIGPLFFSPTPLPHDAAQVALLVSHGDERVALCTDLGEVPARLPELLRHADMLLIESNHDEALLASGPYPEFLKRRVGSARGHLSNRQTHALLRALVPHPSAPASRMQTVVLMHLSETNNRESLALASALDALGGAPIELLAARQSETLRLTVKRAQPQRVPRLQMSFGF
jgi:phosphoribosyl 1,2-cyclic phosphodiesterase